MAEVKDMIYEIQTKTEQMMNRERSQDGSRSPNHRSKLFSAGNDGDTTADDVTRYRDNSGEKSVADFEMKQGMLDEREKRL